MVSFQMQVQVGSGAVLLRVEVGPEALLAPHFGPRDVDLEILPDLGLALGVLDPNVVVLVLQSPDVQLPRPPDRRRRRLRRG